MRILLGCIMGGNSKWYNILYTNSMPLIWNFTNLYFTFRIFILHFSQQLRHMLRKPLQKLEKHQKLQELFLLLTCYPRVTVPSFSITNDNSAFWKKKGGGVVCPQTTFHSPGKGAFRSWTIKMLFNTLTPCFRIFHRSTIVLMANSITLSYISCGM